MAIRKYIMLFILNIISVAGLDNGLAEYPPFIWYSGQRFHLNTDCQLYPDDCISELLVMSTVQTILKRDFKDNGMNYVCIGEGWSDIQRHNTTNELQADKTRFPKGMRVLADYVHKHSMKLGLFLNVNNETAGGYPGSLNYTSLDAATMAAWGIDMIFADGATSEVLDDNSSLLDNRFVALGHALNATGRPMLYTCAWPLYQHNPNMTLISSTCNIYQVVPEQLDVWKGLDNIIKFAASSGKQWTPHMGAGSWPLLNQLTIGDYGSSIAHEEIQMALWTVLPSALVLSSDVRTMRQEDVAVLMHQPVLELIVDPYKSPGIMKTQKGQVYLWRRSISPKGSFVAAFIYVNIAGGPTKQSWKLRDLGLGTASSFNITNLWTGEHLGVYKRWYTLDFEVNPNSVTYFHIVAINPLQGTEL